MIFIETELTGAFIIKPERLEDERGFFARTFCREEFTAHGLNLNTAQCDISFNKRSGTLRGLHYQTAPCEEAKLVRCTRGAIFDVIVDLRRESPSFMQWVSVELTADNHRMLYIPEGLAHGFQTLAKHSEIFYQMSQPYHPEYARGIRWDDPAFRISWPTNPTAISLRDQKYRDFFVMKKVI